MVINEYDLDLKRTSRVLDIPKLKDDKPSSIIHHPGIVRSVATQGNVGQACDNALGRNNETNTWTLLVSKG